MSDELKDVMAYLLKNYMSERKNAPTTTMMNNLVYLADWYQAKEYGRQITDIEWRQSRYKGPFTKDIQTTAENHSEIFETREEAVYEKGQKRLFSLRAQTFQPQLSDMAKKSLDRVLEDFKNDQGDFYEHIRKTPPIRDTEPGDSLNLVEKAKG